MYNADELIERGDIYENPILELKEKVADMSREIGNS